MFVLTTVVVTVYKVKAEKEKEMRCGTSRRAIILLFFSRLFFFSFHLLFSLLISALAYITRKKS